MIRARWLALGASLGAMACVGACALGKVLGQFLFNRSVIYPH